MKQHMQTLIYLLSKNDDNALLENYLASQESENIVQLAYLFREGINDLSKFDVYQQLATKFIGSKSLPTALIAQIKTSDTLSFFTPALQLKENVKKIDRRQRNALHYLFAGNQLVENTPPFNYLRSMMLFGSNKTLCDALCQRDGQNLTPIEVYLLSNQNLTPLPPHELTALLALIEIQSKQQAVDAANYVPTVEAVSALCGSQSQVINSELQRLIFIAIYFAKPIKDVVNKMN
ncbi:MAG: hypothetical protein ACJAZQ_003009 [Cognaticolwellia sp.]|jgi:hypothetical protein